jgi:hypothetical protein
MQISLGGTAGRLFLFCNVVGTCTSLLFQSVPSRLCGASLEQSTRITKTELKEYEHVKVKVKVKQSHYRPGQVLRVPLQAWTGSKSFITGLDRPWGFHYRPEQALRVPLQAWTGPEGSITGLDRPWGFHYRPEQALRVPLQAWTGPKGSITGLDKPWRFQEDEDPRVQDSRRMEVVRLSALHTGRLYPSGNIPGTHFC